MTRSSADDADTKANIEAEVTQVSVIDSHTAGEPTRVVLFGGPELGSGPLAKRARRLEEQHDDFRRTVVGEPRGSEVLVGALMCEPDDPSCDFGVIFFNNVGYLGMCGHGTVGVVETLRHRGRLQGDRCRIQTPVGPVDVRVDGQDISVVNVESFRAETEVKVEAEEVGTVVGDVAWGGNWFFLVQAPAHDIRMENVDELTRVAIAIRRAVHEAGYDQVDHIELFGEPHHSDADSRNFVLCPGLEYDRSPCGTGTSAKLACLAADGKLPPGEDWTQEGILGTSFVGSYEWSDEASKKIVPTITGRAFITQEVRMRLNAEDPFRLGLRDLSAE